MTATTAYNSTEAVLDSLKPFQRRTVDYVFDRLYSASDGVRRFLVADEVGLGKTLVAAGVIARAIERLTALDTARIDVIYICSNQGIARQNINRLRNNLGIEATPLAERITLLPYNLQTLNNRVNLIALTPGTSFSRGKAEGVAKERVILFRMLTDVWGNLGYSARQVFRGSLRSVKRFQDYERYHPRQRVDQGIMDRFRSEVGERGSDLYCEFTELRDRIAGRRGPDVYRIRSPFISKLRRILAHACLSALEPDLVILDEFQRFRDLLNSDTESGELAKRLFEYEDTHTQVRTLLLSATPYKMYTNRSDEDDHHYRDFLRTVQFLKEPDGSTDSLEVSLSRLRSEISLAASGGEIDAKATSRLAHHRDTIQSELRSVMSRTERRGRDAGGDPMLDLVEIDVDLREDDVKAYLQARAVAQAMDAPGVMEYWKSTPYLLSFMGRYKLAELVRDTVTRDPTGEVARLVRNSPGLHFNSETTSRRDELEAGNGRMRSFLDDTRKSNLRKLLWLPPAMPEYTLGDDFENARTATKSLIFSSWTMTPQAIAVMGSYDVEREYIPATDRWVSSGLSLTGTAYSVFAFLYPSATLADAGAPLRYSANNPSELFDAVKERLRPQVEALIRDAAAEGDPQDIWYAAAPILLDQTPADDLHWLHQTRDNADQAEPATWRELVNRVIAGVANPASLGRPPGDLLDVMTALAAGSPANATLRTLARVTSASPTNLDLKRAAERSAWAFRTFFRAPASEGLLRNLYNPVIPVGAAGAYWRRALAYSIEGGLSAVLDEYFHLIGESQGSNIGFDAFADSLRKSLRLGSSSLNVSEWSSNGNGIQRSVHPMRQHFARRYGNDERSDSEQQARLHLDDVRGAFNSPFWPFALATTSIGQEGLDFHWYCHSVTHWNLPSNPVDLEQREGRVNRYHGHAIRKNIAQTVGKETLGRVRADIEAGKSLNPWDVAYRLADDKFKDDEGLTPHWVFPKGDARILRHSPALPLSRDAVRRDALKQSLAVYRMVFGQPRQDDLLEFILREVRDEDRESIAKALMIDLSPPVQSL